MKEGYEIERKFLIAMPDETVLEEGADRKLEIVQTYLLAEDEESARVRKVTENGDTFYIKTVKKRISDMKRLETEGEISEAAYTALLNTADPARQTINKVRYCVPYAGHIFEIDIFSFWKDKAFLEVELSEEGEEIIFPPHFHILREVTEDRRYTNASLALNLPE